MPTRPPLLLFVDGAIRRHVLNDREQCDGAVGLVACDPERPGENIVGAARFFPADRENCTSQRMELRALEFGLLYAEHRLDRARERRWLLWSDSQYAVRSLGGFGWQPTKNLDLIVPLQARCRTAPVRLRHTHGHLARRSHGAYQDHQLHEAADRLAGDAVRGRHDIDGRLGAGPFALDCLTCRHFPCRPRASETAPWFTPHPEPCARRAEWPAQLIERFTKEEVEHAG